MKRSKAERVRYFSDTRFLDGDGEKHLLLCIRRAPSRHFTICWLEEIPTVPEGSMRGMTCRRLHASSLPSRGVPLRLSEETFNACFVN